MTLSVYHHFADRDPLTRIVLERMLEAERQFRRIIGYQQPARLALAIERDLAPSITTEEVVISARQRNTSSNGPRSAPQSESPAWGRWESNPHLVSQSGV